MPYATVTAAEEQALIKRHLSKDHLTIIEAGCGRAWPKEIANPTFTLIGVDLDQKAADARKDLSRLIVGDIRTVDLPNEAADVVYSAYVLEHVQGAERALRNFVNWLKPGGVMIILVPDRDSVYGFITRMTPHWVHIAYWRYLGGFKNAGRPGYGPYPTVHEPIISVDGIRRFCDAHDCLIEEVVATSNYLDRGTALPLRRAVARTLSALSFGRLHWRHNNLCLVIRKAGREPLDSRTAVPAAREARAASSGR
jgi:SAM-dependent methyltransferase